MIIAVAILYDGVVFSVAKPARHHDVIKKHFDETGLKGSGDQNGQGFLTDTGEFLDRKASAIHTRECGQFTDRVKIGHKKRLFSEDVW